MNSNNSWIDNRKAYTYEQLSDLLGCTPLTVRKLVEKHQYTVLSGTRGRNGKPALVLLSDANLNSLYRDGVDLAKNQDGLRGRKWINFSTCKMSRENLSETKKTNEYELKQYDKYHVHYKLSCNLSEYILFDNTVFKIKNGFMESDFIPTQDNIEVNPIYYLKLICIGINEEIKYNLDCLYQKLLSHEIKFVLTQNSKNEWISFSKHSLNNELSIKELFSFNDDFDIYKYYSKS